MNASDYRKQRDRTRQDLRQHIAQTLVIQHLIRKFHITKEGSYLPREAETLLSQIEGITCDLLKKEPTS